MKKGLIIAISILLVLVLLLGILAIVFVCSPQWALYRTLTSVREKGLRGLKGHVTDEAWDTIERILSIAENSMVQGILGAIGGDQAAVGALAEHARDIQWTLEDVKTGKNSADVVIGFDYKGDIVGTVELTMVRSGYTWKISGLEMPKFEKFFDK